MLRDTIQLNTLFTHVVSQEKVTREGVHAITRYLYSIKLRNISGTIRNQAYVEHYGKNPDTLYGAMIEKPSEAQLEALDDWDRLPDLPDGQYPQIDRYRWEWDWTIQKGTFRGTLVKRVQMFYKQVFGINLSDLVLREVGNIAAANRSKPETYYFEFVNEFAWQAGDFGDSGSCFWQSRTRDKYALLYNQVWAVRFYTDETKHQGKARAWVAIDRPDENSMIVFNGYGFHGDATVEIAKILADYYEIDTKSVHIQNQGSETGSIFLNNQGRGRIVAHSDAIKAFAAIYPKSDLHKGDFTYDFKFHTDILGRCEHTGVWLRREDWHYQYGGRYYSKAAFDLLFATCAVSEETMLRSEMHELPDGRVVTARVWRDMTVPCHWCGDSQLKDSMNWIDGSLMMVCDDCLNNRTALCEVTGSRYMFEYMIEIPELGMVSDVGLENLSEMFYNEFPASLTDLSLSSEELSYLRDTNIVGHKETIEGTSSDTLALAIGDALHNIDSSVTWAGLKAAFNENRFKYLAAYVIKTWQMPEGVE